MLAALWSMDINRSSNPRYPRNLARWFLALGYCAAGVVHILRPQWLMEIMPAWVPFPQEVIVITGICEIIGAIALLGRRYRRAAGIALAVYAVCVYPANIKHAIDNLSSASAVLGWWYHAPRLAFQPILVWLALYAGDVVEWPFRSQYISEKNR